MPRFLSPHNPWSISNTTIVSQAEVAIFKAHRDVSGAGDIIGDMGGALTSACSRGQDTENDLSSPPLSRASVASKDDLGGTTTPLSQGTVDGSQDDLGGTLDISYVELPQGPGGPSSPVTDMTFSQAPGTTTTAKVLQPILPRDAVVADLPGSTRATSSRDQERPHTDALETPMPTRQSTGKRTGQPLNGNFYHRPHRKLSKWQLPVLPVIDISSKWRVFPFSFVTSCMNLTHASYVCKLRIQVTPNQSRHFE